MKTTLEEADSIKRNFDLINKALSRVIVGQTEVIRNIYISILCGGHVLIEGVPGLGKTLIVKTFSKILDLKYSRIQFTPDLMPADILGTNIVNEDEKGNRYFEFYKGPIFGQIILADEINRATPKTQSALLEAMQEEKVTVFGTEYALEPPFMVLATQNPLEMEGTYPLPEAQVDRFFFKLKVNYPTPDQLMEIIEKTTEEEEPELAKVMDPESILRMKALVMQTPVAEHVKHYAIRLVMATHPGNSYHIKRAGMYVHYGSSPRGVQTLIRAGKVAALLSGRYNVSLEDIRDMAGPALRHRIIMNLRAEAEGIDADEIIHDILKGVPERARD